MVFDLDGTLLRGTTVSLLLAEWLGQAAEIAELERAFLHTRYLIAWWPMLPLDGSRGRARPMLGEC